MAEITTVATIFRSACDCRLNVFFKMLSVARVLGMESGGNAILSNFAKVKTICRCGFGQLKQRKRGTVELCENQNYLSLGFWAIAATKTWYCRTLRKRKLSVAWVLDR